MDISCFVHSLLLTKADTLKSVFKKSENVYVNSKCILI